MTLYIITILLYCISSMTAQHSYVWWVTRDRCDGLYLLPHIKDKSFREKKLWRQFQGWCGQLLRLTSKPTFKYKSLAREIRGVQKKTRFWIFVFLISQLLYIGFLTFLRLPYIIRGILCGVGTRMLKIRCLAAEIWAKQKIQMWGFSINTL